MTEVFQWLDTLPTYPFIDTMAMIVIFGLCGYGSGYLRAHKMRDREEQERSRIRNSVNKYN